MCPAAVEFIEITYNHTRLIKNCQIDLRAQVTKRHPSETPYYDVHFVFEFGLILCIEDIGIFLPEALKHAFVSMDYRMISS